MNLCLDDVLHVHSSMADITLGQKLTNDGLKDDRTSALQATELVGPNSYDTSNIGLNSCDCFQLERLRLTDFSELLAGQETTCVVLRIRVDKREQVYKPVPRVRSLRTEHDDRHNIGPKTSEQRTEGRLHVCSEVVQASTGTASEPGDDEHGLE